MKITAAMKKSTPFRYAADVRSGKIVCGKFISLAVDRFYRWLETADEDGYYLDHAAGMRPIEFFFKFINHTKGAMAGEAFELAPFQQFTMYNLFGWKDKTTQLRRIKKVYDKRAKKNGKSAEMAGLALYVMADDGESEAEVYVGATKEDQAKICWEQAKNFIDSPLANPLLRAIGFSTRLKEIRFAPTASKMKPLGGDSKTQDGINSHLSIIDEYHAHRDDSVKENLESSSVQRTQPITYHITTAGVNISSVCFNYEKVCKELLLGLKEENDHIWIMIHEMDEEDNWQLAEHWVKANPLLGQGLKLKALTDEFKDAILQPSKQTNFKTKHLNMWVDAPSAWILDEIWMQNSGKVQLKNFIKHGCYGGLDLSTTTDLTSLSFVSNPDKKGYQDCLSFVFCPKETIDRRAKEDGVPYRHWSELAYGDYISLPQKGRKKFKKLKSEITVLIATEGNVVDYEIIEDYVYTFFFLLNCQGVLYDRHNSTGLITRLLERGVEMLQFAQTIMFYSYPTKEFEKKILSGKMRHGGHPVMRWCLSGCVTKSDLNENIRLDKAKSTKRIDPLISAVMAMAGVLNQEKPESNKSIYNDDNVTFYA